MEVWGAVLRGEGTEGDAMALHRVSVHRATALRTSALSVAHTISMGVMSGEQAGWKRCTTRLDSRTGLGGLVDAERVADEADQAILRDEHDYYVIRGVNAARMISSTTDIARALGLARDARPRRRRMSHSVPVGREPWRMPSNALSIRIGASIQSRRSPAMKGAARPELCPPDRVQRRTGGALAMRQWSCRGAPEAPCHPVSRLLSLRGPSVRQ